MLLSSSVWRGNARWWFSGGLLAGGVTSGLVAVVVGSLFRPVITPIVAVVLIVALLLAVAAQEVGLFTLSLPQNARQVPQSIIQDGEQIGALQFGFEMGTGVRTFMTSGLPHVLLLCVLLLAGWPTALLSGLAFGAGRAWMMLSRLWHGDVVAWDMALAECDRFIRVVLAGAATVVVIPILIAAAEM
ncbi:hypothetical protein [Salinispora arenicola]|uniref:hypothetical protein n=1 Tax=Salinispora arenicola TaxID=168697 RepID=UPI00036D9893|nr:hypothetical protein [Salinispora arenicola]